MQASDIDKTLISKISMDQYNIMVRDPDSSEAEILYYSILVEDDSGFEYRIVADPDKVDYSTDPAENENAMQFANNWCRRRRRSRFWKRYKRGSQLPVLVEEGDSWHQFPILIDEVIDNLEDDYLIYSLGAAGDTLRNMAIKNPEYAETLMELQHDGVMVSGFMFSAAGNDIIGYDKKTKQRVLLGLLNDFEPAQPNEILPHIKMAELDKKLSFVYTEYSNVIQTIHNLSGYQNLPIFLHGYDHVFPFPFYGEENGGKHSRKRKWLGHPLDEKGIMEPSLRRRIIAYMINRLYGELQKLEQKHHNVYVVDCRGSMPHLSDWNDEIHGTSKGFAKVANRFRDKLNLILGP